LSILGLFFLKHPESVTAAQIEAMGKGAAANPLFWPFFGLMLLHCLVYVPTLSIANTIAFTHLSDAKKDYGIVRMGGTLGWILVAWPFVFILVDWASVPAFSSVGLVNWFGAIFGNGLKGAALQEGVRTTFLVSGIISLALACFSLTLPHTPPKTQAGQPQAWMQAFKLLAEPFVFILFAVTFLDAFVHNLYFAWTGGFLENKVGIAGNWVK
jgi:Nucleoside H+ symporter